jgi:dephospho-CoA kinase
MLRVGLTGGIGSGKSTVSRFFRVLGIPVLDADETARQLMNYDKKLVQEISTLLGADVYKDGVLDRSLVSARVFHDRGLLTQLNNIVHPATMRYADVWHRQQIAPYTLKEAALFFESGSAAGMDVMIGVTAPLEVRIQRVMSRNGLSREQVLDRIANQMGEGEKMGRCRYVICNDDQLPVIPQVLNIHQELLTNS